MVLVKFSKTSKGKFLLLILIIVSTLYNRTGGVLIAMLFIFLSEFNYEINNGIMYEGFEPSMDVTNLAYSSADPNKLKINNKKPDQLSIAEQLKSKNSDTIPFFLTK